MLRIYPAHTRDPEQRLGSMAASDAEKLLKTYTYHDQDPGSPAGRGYQRPPDPTRFSAIATYIEKHGVTPLIICDRGRWSTLLPGSETMVQMDILEVIAALKRADVSDEEMLASILDGQHRFRALLLLLSRGVDLQIPFLLLANLSWAEEVIEFNTINTTAKNLPKALVEVNRYAIFTPEGATNRDVQRQHVREVVMALETDKDSIWHEQVNMTGGRNTNRPVTFEGLRRSSEATFAGRLGLLPLPKKVELAKVYWRVVADTWPDAWHGVPVTVDWVNPETGEVEPQERIVKYRIKDLAGVSALAKLANQVLMEAYNFEDDRLNTAIVRSRLSRAKDISWIRDRENPDMNSQAGFAGLADMYEMLLSRTYGTNGTTSAEVSASAPVGATRA